MITGQIVAISQAPPSTEHPPYTLEMAERVCQAVATGATITDLPKPLPRYATITRWRRLVPEFAEMLQLAVQDRAEYYHDKLERVMDEARSSSAEDRTSLAKMESDNYKWMAKVGNPDRFGDRTKVSGDMAAPLTIILDTGIRRNEAVEKLVEGPVMSTLAAAPSVEPEAIHGDPQVQSDILPPPGEEK